MGADIANRTEMKGSDRAVVFSSHLTVVKSGLTGIMKTVTPGMFETSQAVRLF